MLAHQMHFFEYKPEVLKPMFLVNPVKANWARATFESLVRDPEAVLASTAAQLQCGHLKRGAVLLTRCARGLNVGALNGFFEVTSPAGSTMFVHLEEYLPICDDCWDLSNPKQLVAPCSIIVDSIAFVQRRPQVIRILQPPALYVERAHAAA